MAAADDQDIGIAVIVGHGGLPLFEPVGRGEIAGVDSVERLRAGIDDGIEIERGGEGPGFRSPSGCRSSRTAP